MLIIIITIRVIFGAGLQDGEDWQSMALLRAPTKPVLTKEDSVRLVQLDFSFTPERTG